MSQKPRVTVCLRPDGTFELLLNEAGRDLDWDRRYYPHVMATEGRRRTRSRVAARSAGLCGGRWRRSIAASAWWVEDGELHVSSSLGGKHWSAGRPAAVGTLPSEAAVGLLWEVAREADPKRPFFYWR